MSAPEQTRGRTNKPGAWSGHVQCEVPGSPCSASACYHGSYPSPHSNYKSLPSGRQLAGFPWECQLRFVKHLDNTTVQEKPSHWGDRHRNSQQSSPWPPCNPPICRHLQEIPRQHIHRPKRAAYMLRNIWIPNHSQIDFVMLICYEIKWWCYINELLCLPVRSWLTALSEFVYSTFS